MTALKDLKSQDFLMYARANLEAEQTGTAVASVRHDEFASTFTIPPTG